MCALVKTVLALPVLGLVSIPLLLSAWVTISFALFTLCVRLGIVYLELVSAFLVNFFTLPASSTSFLTFASSEPPTPIASRRNSGHGPIQSRRSNDSLLTLGLTHDESSKPRQKSYARSMAEAHLLPTPFIDESRDFEGVGGWRPFHDTKRRGSHTNEKPLSSHSSSAPSIAGEVDIDDEIDDEVAWLSLNHRLELPSQVIAVGSTTGSTVHSPILSPRNVNNIHAYMPVSSRFYQAQPEQRHHHRSHTTSSLTTSHRRTGSGLSLGLAKRLDQSRDSGHSISPSVSRAAPFMTPQPYSHVQPRPLNRSTNATHVNGNLSRDGSFDGTSGNGGGYFAIPRLGSWYMPSLSGRETPSTSGYTTPRMGLPGEEPLHLTRLMAHYPASVRHRRRSISGPHARAPGPAERG
ncbi:hypothetical protein N7523_003701 [Penicillium sp. IBT 18751x]|nr:hypothetical protein N7523_003701 [Penicillium sp. IBT 18751x]